MKGRKKKIINIAIIFIIAISFVTTGIKAATTIAASMVTYKDTTVEAELDELITKASKLSEPVTCTPGHYCTTSTSCPSGALCSKVSIGDYVSMTPSSTYYYLNSNATGYGAGGLFVNPSELNLWRVIDIRDDGTIDMVSEYVSSREVYFSGQKGYLNFVGTLNLIAKQYENSKYTVGSRHMGYGGQTQVITDTSKFTNPSPWTAATSTNDNESVGGGDIMYKTDETLVKNALGTLYTYKVGTTTQPHYWIASRYYNGRATDNDYHWGGHIVLPGPGVVGYDLYSYKSGWIDKSNGASIRPIVTLRAGVTTSGGDGTSGSPWQLQ